MSGDPYQGPFNLDDWERPADWKNYTCTYKPGGKAAMMCVINFVYIEGWINELMELGNE